ncbi:hypothetical protein PF007_g20517 [Phytophthora fragariae]|uniref:Uncharacterized protein n=1 Tax=Phytophthora fragariae TaxID=53985 RepID=A0A6A3R0N1_9STRA|nr:hypothetical protein PF007_g20517 [Phytophthora fragariae]
MFGSDPHLTPDQSKSYAGFFLMTAARHPPSARSAGSLRGMRRTSPCTSEGSSARAPALEAQTLHWGRGRRATAAPKQHHPVGSGVGFAAAMVAVGS